MLGRFGLAVVIPALDEERLINKTIATIPEIVDVTIVVDDGSRDRTFSIAGAADTILIRHHRNLGVGRAIASGYRKALEIGAHVVVVMAGDSQMDPEDLPLLLAPIAAGTADYSKGTRFEGGKTRGRMPVVRLFGNRILTNLTRIALGAKGITDAQCGYTAITRKALLSLPLSSIYPRYGYPNDLLFRVMERGLRVKEVPVKAVYNGERSKMRLVTAIPRISFLLISILLKRMSKKAKRLLETSTLQRKKVLSSSLLQ